MTSPEMPVVEQYLFMYVHYAYMHLHLRQALPVPP
jgi:hypothetical protein